MVKDEGGGGGCWQTDARDGIARLATRPREAQSASLLVLQP
jgi:hypothetical protein